MLENEFKSFFIKEKEFFKKFEIKSQDIFDIIDIKTKVENEQFYLKKTKKNIKVIMDNIIILKIRTVDKNNGLITEKENIINTFDSLVYDKIDYFEQLNKMYRFKLLSLIINDKDITFFIKENIIFLEIFYTIKLNF